MAFTNFDSVLKIIKNILVLIVLCQSGISFSQPGKNIPQFDRRKFHFGFSLGGNTADFRYRFSPGVYNNDSIVNVNISKVPGFNFGIVSSWDISEVFHLRFLPSLSFQERQFSYGVLLNNNVSTVETRLESTFLDFPLLLKLRTKRINNFAAYGLAGAQYSLDLASQADVKTAPGQRDVMKMKRHDFATQFGGGFDFFMAYYKFAVEIKISNGFSESLIQEDIFFTSPLTSLKSKVWWFTITFEG
ncbi:MAG: porin family protein [Crocinitomicaceae bacterium]